jgi:HPt (histidine-containing phosphotransfer) domain-containing protein
MQRLSPSQSSSSNAGNPVLDELRAAVDVADFALILGVFETDADAQLNDLQDFVCAGKHDAARRVAHRLAGLLAQFGATEAAELAHRLAGAASDPDDAETVARLLRTCRMAVADICTCTDRNGDAEAAAVLAPPTAKLAAGPANRVPHTLPPQTAGDLAIKATVVRTSHSRRSETTAPLDW